jgi:hypothetical protein
MGKWRYSSAILDVGTRWRCVVSFTPRPLLLSGKKPGTHWIGGLVGLRACLGSVEFRKSFPLPGSKPLQSSLYPVAILTELSRLLR